MHGYTKNWNAHKSNIFFPFPLKADTKYNLEIMFFLLNGFIFTLERGGQKGNKMRKSYPIEERESE